MSMPTAIFFAKEGGCAAFKGIIDFHFVGIDFGISHDKRIYNIFNLADFIGGEGGVIDFNIINKAIESPCSIARVTNIKGS